MDGDGGTSADRAPGRSPADALAPVDDLGERRQELIVLRGLPGAGKTTRRRALLAADPALRHVNKDELRERLRGPAGPADEALVHAEHGRVLDRLLAAGHSVVVDNTSLDERELRRYAALAAAVGASLRVDELAVPWRECVERDRRRAERGERAVGRSVIVRMALEHDRYGEPAAPAAVVDLDAAFGARPAAGEAPLPDVAAALDALCAQTTVLVVTAASERDRGPLDRWLAVHTADRHLALLCAGDFSGAPPPDGLAAWAGGSRYRALLVKHFRIAWAVDHPDRHAAWRRTGATPASTLAATLAAVTAVTAGPAVDRPA